MEQFRSFLQQQYLERKSRNPNYSLRAYAKFLKTSHATLSSILTGKRKITEKTVRKLSSPFGLGPQQTSQFLQPVNSQKTSSYFVIQQDAFNSMSEWHYDAILELTLIKKIKITASNVADILEIPEMDARFALETLERLELLEKNKDGRYKLTHKNSTNILDPNFTTAAAKKHQITLLKKSIEAVESVPRSERDHTSMTMAIDRGDLAEVKKLIKKFRTEINSYLQRADVRPNEIYQLQIGFFPISKIQKGKV